MPTLSITHPITPEEWSLLHKEFPYYRFLESVQEETEILFGERLTREELLEAPLLRWIHLPSPNKQGIPMEEILKLGSILVTFTPERGNERHGEWALAALLFFLKGLSSSHLGEKPLFPPLSLEGREWLELSAEGPRALSNIAFAKRAGMRVLGIRKERSFTPGLDKLFGADNLLHRLQVADTISFAAEMEAPALFKLHERELSSLKRGAILLISTEERRVDALRLRQKIEAGELRGVAIDTREKSFLKRFEGLEGHPSLLLTPGIASLPSSSKEEAYPLFRKLLRNYTHENFMEMAPRLEGTLSNGGKRRLSTKGER